MQVHSQFFSGAGFYSGMGLQGNSLWSGAQMSVYNIRKDLHLQVGMRIGQHTFSDWRGSSREVDLAPYRRKGTQVSGMVGASYDFSPKGTVSLFLFMDQQEWRGLSLVDHPTPGFSFAVASDFSYEFTETSRIHISFLFEKGESPCSLRGYDYGISPLSPMALPMDARMRLGGMFSPYNF